MEKNSATRIVCQTFQNPFAKEPFVYFIKSLLNHIEPAPFIYRGNFIPDAYEPYIKTLERIGKYQDGDDKKIDLLIVHLKKETSLERARTMQRNFITWYLNGSRGDVLKDAALVAFVSPNSDDWRFSLVKMDYRLDASGEKVKVQQELTPARRFSFLVGKTESSHTAQSRLVPILQDDSRDPSLQDLEEAFSIEKVTKEFFEKYRELFLKVKEALDEVVKKDKKVKQDFEIKDIDTVNFAKKLLGQVVFLYFLQKKGWFGVERDEDWGSGPKNFLRLLFEKRIAKYGNFFNEILEPLFYEALAIERTDDFYSRFNCKIPFLNGGLFDPINNYDWIHTDILLPNDLFSNTTKTKEGDVGTGILDIFDRYNFTVKEDEPLEKEVAVDPEMLGKVFENLLEVKDRKSKGTYYTPREIVHYMCQQSLINYLATELEGKVKKEDIETLIKYGETVVEHDSRVVKQGKETKTYSFKLPKSIRDNTKLIDEKLTSIRVCDPAVGSGAFPVGMMNEVIRTRNALTNYLKDKKKRTIYDFKRHAIQNCLYGVDIDPGAVELAKLRLWLSLVVDEEDIKQIKPLPNLDYKIMQGNSLLEEYQGIKLIDERFFKKQESQDEIIKRLQERQNKLQREYISLHSKKQLTAIKKTELEKRLSQINKEIKNYQTEPKDYYGPIGLFGISDKQKKASQLLEMQKQFFSTASKNEKDKLKEKIEKLTWELIAATLREQGEENKLKGVIQFRKANIRPFFLWRLHFAEVFQEKDGFDVMIANPPYVRQEEIKEFKPLFQTQYEIYNSTSDLYTYFYEKSWRILKPKGFFCFISSNKWMRAKYGGKLRKFLQEKTRLLNIIDFGGYKIFEAAVDTCILLFQKIIPNIDTVLKVVKAGEDFDIGNINEYVNKNSIQLTQGDLDINGWALFDSQILTLKKKIEAQGTTIKDWGIKLFMGVKTGFNKAFIIDATKKKQLITQDSKNEEIIESLLKGKDVRKYHYNFKERYIILTKNKIDIKKEYPIIYKHLSRFKEELEKRWDKGNHWSNLRDCDYYEQFEKPKLIYPDIEEKLSFAFDEQGYYCDNTAYILSSDNKYLLAVVNSSLSNFYYSLISSQLGTKGIRHFSIFIERIPIKRISEDEQKPFIDLVDKILAITKSLDYFQNEAKQKRVKEYEHQIDKLVYKLYGLTKKEIKIIKNK